MGAADGNPADEAAGAVELAGRGLDMAADFAEAVKVLCGNGADEGLGLQGAGGEVSAGGGGRRRGGRGGGDGGRGGRRREGRGRGGGGDGDGGGGSALRVVAGHLRVAHARLGGPGDVEVEPADGSGQARLDKEPVQRRLRWTRPRALPPTILPPPS